MSFDKKNAKECYENAREYAAYIEDVMEEVGFTMYGTQQRYADVLGEPEFPTQGEK